MRLTNLDRLILTTAMLTVALPGCNDSVLSSDSNRVSESESLSRTVDATAASELVAETINGQIMLRAVDGDVVTVEAFKKVEAHDRSTAQSFLEDVEVTVEQRDDQIVVLTSYPKPPNNVNVSVQFDITAPADLIARLTSVNGAVEVTDMEKVVAVQTTNGQIEVTGAGGPITLMTVNGAVSADLAQLLGEGAFSAVNGSVNVTVRDGEMPITATTVNGAVTVSLPGEFDGSLDAQTANGKARSDFSVTATGTQASNRIVGSIGTGGSPVVTLRSTNGDVSLRRN